MIRRYTVNFDNAGAVNWGYNLYGAFLQKLPPELAELIHNPDSMRISGYFDKGRWVVTFFGEEAAQAFETLMAQKDYFLDRYNAPLNVVNLSAEDIVTEKDFVRRYMADKPPSRNITIRFITPTAFKSNGEYINMPTPRLVLQSLMLKWERIAKEYSLYDEDSLSHLNEYCKTSAYSLKSSKYRLKGVSIPAFTGYVTLNFGGPEQLVRLACLLSAFGGYAGVGIKTALGMGGCEVRI